MDRLTFFRLDRIDPQKNLLVINYKSHSINVDYSLVNQFQDLIGNVYEIYGSVEVHECPAPSINNITNDSKHIYISALLIDIVKDGGDMTIIEQSLKIFNNSTFPEYKETFI